MAKYSQTGSERSKVRIFFVEGDFAPGDLQQLTQALTTAIRPTHVATRGALAGRIAPPAGNGTGAANGEGDVAEVEIEPVGEDFADDAETQVAPVSRGPSKPRVYRKPKVVDIDLSGGEGGKSFEEFATEKKPDDHVTRYLVIAVWLHEHAKIETIRVDHVFTCYKSMDWTFDVSDPSWPFRKLKADGMGTTKAGSFSVGHLGIAKVKKMAPAAT